MTPRTFTLPLVTLVLVITLLVFAAACATSLPISPAAVAMSADDLTATAFCVQLTDTGENIALWMIFGSPTPPPGVVLPTPTARNLPISGDVERGEALFHGAGACANCHLTESEETFVGPSLKTVANRAGYKRPGMDAKTYLYNVIVNPDLNINPLTKPGVMPRTFEQKLTQQEIADIVEYLLTLKT